MRKQVEKIVNRIMALNFVGGFAIILFDAGSWAVVLACWSVAWIVLQLAGQSIATELEKRLPPPPYRLLVRPIDTESCANGFEGLDVSGACSDTRIAQSRERKRDPITLGTCERGIAA